MARITKDLNTKDSRLNTEVISQQTSLGEIDSSSLKDNQNIKKLMSLTPGIAAIVSKTVLLEKQSEEKKLKKLKEDEELAKKMQEKSLKEGKEHFQIGTPNNQIANKDTRIAATAYNDVSVFNNVIKQKEEEGYFNKIDNESELRSSLGNLLIEHTNSLVKDGKITEEMALNEVYVKAQTMAQIGYSNSLVDGWKKSKIKDDMFQTEQSISHIFSSSFENIKSIKSDAERQNAIQSLIVNNKSLVNGSLGIDISNKQSNDALIGMIDRYAATATTSSDVKFLNELVEISKTPYETGKYSDIDNPDVKNKNSLYTGNAEKMLMIGKKIKSVENKKKEANVYDIKVIESNLGEFAEQSDGVSKVFQKLQDANASSAKIQGVLFNLQEKRKEYSEQMDDVDLSVNGTDLEHENLKSKLDSKPKEYRDKTVERIFSEKTNGEVTNVEGYFDMKNVEAAMDVTSKFGEVKSFKSMIDKGSSDLTSKSAEVLSYAIEKLILNDYTKEDIGEKLNMSLADVEASVAVRQLISATDDPKERKETLEALQKRKSLISNSNFMDALNDNGLTDIAKDGINGILESINMKEDEPYYEETREQIRGIIKVKYAITEDLESSIVDAKRVMQNEFFEIKGSKIRADKKIKEAGYNTVNQNITTSLESISNSLTKTSDFKRDTFDFFGGLFNLDNPTDNPFDDLNLSYDSEEKKHYVTDSVGQIKIDYKTSKKLKESDNIEVGANGRVYIKDITKPVIFADKNAKSVYKFDSKNQTTMMRKFEAAYGKVRLNEKYNFLIDERVSTTEDRYVVNTDDLEKAIKRVNSYNMERLKESDLSGLNAYASQIANKTTRLSLEEWKKIK